VTAFQRLWNRNHPEDVIPEDGVYGTETEKRVARSPVGGFARGADGCADADAPPATPPPATPAITEPVPDAAEPASEDDGGCSVSARGTRSSAYFVAIVGLAALAASVRRRRR
jgi:MYXO-CTERM domain-containing protein